MTKSTKSIDGFTKSEFITYLQETLIPDLTDGGLHETAKDFRTAIKFLIRSSLHPSTSSSLRRDMIDERLNCYDHKTELTFAEFSKVCNMVAREFENFAIDVANVEKCVYERMLKLGFRMEKRNQITINRIMKGSR